MDLRFTPEEVALPRRDEEPSSSGEDSRAHIRERLGAGRHVGKDDWVASQRIMNAAGLGGAALAGASGAAEIGRRFSATSTTKKCC